MYRNETVPRAREILTAAFTERDFVKPGKCRFRRVTAAGRHSFFHTEADALLTKAKRKAYLNQKNQEGKAKMRLWNKCVSMALAGGLSAVAMFGAASSTVNINIPHAVEVGSVVLPQGAYTLTGFDLNGGDELFVVRGGNGESVTLQARRVASDTASGTKIEFATGSAAWKFERLSIAGQATAFEFVNFPVSSEK